MPRTDGFTWRLLAVHYRRIIPVHNPKLLTMEHSQVPTQKSKRVTVESLICEGLGYCCEFAFFTCFKRTGLIAERLGVEARTVRYHKMAFKDGRLKCRGAATCLKGKL